MQQKAAANDEENFGLVLGEEFMKGVVAQLNTSEDMAIKSIDDEGLQHEHDRDLFGLHLANICAASFGAAAAANISSQIFTVDGHDLARVHVEPSGFPVDAR
jgi:type I restriction enzyme R subunit